MANYFAFQQFKQTLISERETWLFFYKPILSMQTTPKWESRRWTLSLPFSKWSSEAKCKEGNMLYHAKWCYTPVFSQQGSLGPFTLNLTLVRREDWRTATGLPGRSLCLTEASCLPHPLPWSWGKVSKAWLAEGLAIEQPEPKLLLQPVPTAACVFESLHILLVFSRAAAGR